MWLIRRLLKAGATKDGVVSSSDQGILQGSVASPILSNIYLHYVLDLWFEKVFKSKAKAYVELIRYCDDYVVCCESAKDAEEFLNLLQDRLKGFGLSISEEKTRKVKFGRRPYHSKIRKLIEQNGSIKLDEMMLQVTSVSPSSYYQKQNKLGCLGDFTTAPEISQLFGEMIALWAIDQWYKMDCPQKN